MHLDAPLCELFRDDAGGADLLEPDLGMRMEIPADRGEFVGIAFDTFNTGHVCYPVAEGSDSKVIWRWVEAPFIRFHAWAATGRRVSMMRANMLMPIGRILSSNM